MARQKRKLFPLFMEKFKFNKKEPDVIFWLVVIFDFLKTFILFSSSNFQNVSFSLSLHFPFKHTSTYHPHTWSFFLQNSKKRTQPPLQSSLFQVCFPLFGFCSIFVICSDSSIFLWKFLKGVTSLQPNLQVFPLIVNSKTCWLDSLMKDNSNS